VRRIPRAPCPPLLDPVNPHHDVATERAAIASQLNGAPTGWVPSRKRGNLALGARFTISVSSYTYAKDYILNVFGNRCGYCEAPVFLTDGGEIEHYRPTKEVDFGHGPRKPGYYWLASDWSNLLLCCHLCNVRRRVPVDGVFETRGKHTYFPLAAGTTNARFRHELSNELPLLLNPTTDDPDYFLRFNRDGYVRPASPRQNSLRHRRAEESILAYGLDRDDLREARHTTILAALLCLSRIRTKLGQLATAPAIYTSLILTDIQTDISDFMPMINGEWRYFAMWAQVVIPELLDIVHTHHAIIVSHGL
jgi:uncharacterized protein (TIGR02646 family)